MTTRGAMILPKAMERVRENSKHWLYDRKDINVDWNIESPWKPKTTHPQGAVMGGGKGKVKFYYTPVKARTIICEIYGKNMNPEENYPWIMQMALACPGECIVVTPSILQSLLREEWLIEELNQNPFTMREVLMKNMNNFSRDQATKHEFKYLGKYYN